MNRFIGTTDEVTVERVPEDRVEEGTARVSVGDDATVRSSYIAVSGPAMKAALAAVAADPLADVRVEQHVALGWPTMHLLQVVSPEDGMAREALFDRPRPGSRPVKVNPRLMPFFSPVERVLLPDERELVGEVSCPTHPDRRGTSRRARGMMIMYDCPLGHAFWRPLGER